MKRRFVFVDPPSPPGFVSFKHSHGGYGEFCRQSRLRVPTLDLFHAASLLLENGHDARVVDSVLEEHDPEGCAEAVVRHAPQWVVVRTAAASLPHDLETARAIRRRSKARIVFYGPSLTREPLAPLDCEAVDASVPGDSPFPFLDMARRGRLDGAAGVLLRGAAAPAAAPAPLSPTELDGLPVPRWDLVDYRRYSYVTTQTSWGCPFECGYCSYPVTQGSRWRARSVASVVSEFQALRERYGLRFVLLRDPEFTLRKDRTVELCRALIDAGTPILWGCETRLDTLDDALIALMAKAGCMRVNFGVESLEPAVLRRMGRPDMGRDFIRRRVAKLKKSGLLTYALYIIGLPGETEASTRRLIDFALELDTEAASFSMATPFPGTRLEAIARENGWVTARDPRRLTSSVPSMRNESLDAGAVERLYFEAKERWRNRKTTASPLSSPT